MKALFISLLSLLLLAHAGIAQHYQQIDTHARNVPAKAGKSLESLTAYLSRPAKSDQEKVRSFFVWISENIIYDVQALQSFNPARTGRITPAEVLKTGKAVCQGYAELMQEMCRLSGIKSYVIPGYSKGFGYQPGNRSFTQGDHAWNAVLLDGQWYLLDVTWGSGGLNPQMKYVKQFHEAYFLAAPEEFVKNHLPLEPVWQLLDCPVSLRAFVQGEEAIGQELSGSKEPCLNYAEAIRQWENMPEQERDLQSASSAYAFNPANHQVMARGYMDYAHFILKSIRPEMRSRQEIEEGMALQEQALGFLKKAEVLLNKVKDAAADYEKEILRRNIQLSEQNLAAMKKALKG